MITASIVSHGHGPMVNKLILQLLECPEVSRIKVTINIAEKFEYIEVSNKIEYINNATPKGYGANHNYAFRLAESKFFCVLNPDIELVTNPFPSLLATTMELGADLIGPIVLSKSGGIEDSMRYFPTLKTLFRKLIYDDQGRYPFEVNERFIYPNWIAGMFMLFVSDTYKKIGGFDEAFFMYYEDVDICNKVLNGGGLIVGDFSTSVIHDARRASRKNFLHLKWHLASMLRYLWRYR